MKQDNEVENVLYIKLCVIVKGEEEVVSWEAFGLGDPDEGNPSF